MVESEIKVANEELREHLDEELGEILPLLLVNKKKEEPETQKTKDSYEQIANELRTMEKVAPIKKELTDKEKAKQRRQKLEELQ